MTRPVRRSWSPTGLLVLQDDAPRALPAELRAKTRVVFQSARTLVPWPHKSSHRLHCVLVAHLREEKDPATAFAAWRLLPRDIEATLTIIGAALDPALGRAAPRPGGSRPARAVGWGPRDHAWTRQAIKRAHLLVIPSRMEGGANVVVEAVTSGTAILGTRMSGNVGMLGDDYAGYFAVGHPAEPRGPRQPRIARSGIPARARTRMSPARAPLHARRRRRARCLPSLTKPRAARE